MSEKTIPELLRNRVKECGTRLLFQRRDGWSWKQITWLDFDREVKNIASFLMDLGFGPGDKAVVASSNRLEAISAEIAVFHLGGVVVPLSPGESHERVIKASGEVGAKFVFIEQGPSLDGVLESPGLIPGADRIIVFPDAKIKDERVLNFKAVLKFGLMKRKKLEDELSGVSKSIDPESPAALFLDSGNGGGKLEVSQGKMLEALRSIAERYPQLNAEDQSFSYMTAASPFSKFINYLTLYKANRAAIAESMKDFYMDIVEVMPTLLYETRADLEIISRESVSGESGRNPGKKLRLDLGNRVNHIFTDRLPGTDTGRLFSRAGIELHEIEELSGIIS